MGHLSSAVYQKRMEINRKKKHAIYVAKMEECIKQGNVQEDDDGYVSLEHFTENIKLASDKADTEYYRPTMGEDAPKYEKSCKEHLEDVIKIAQAAIKFQELYGF